MSTFAELQARLERCKHFERVFYEQAAESNGALQEARDRIVAALSWLDAKDTPAGLMIAQARGILSEWSEFRPTQTATASKQSPPPAASKEKS